VEGSRGLLSNNMQKKVPSFTQTTQTVYKRNYRTYKYSRLAYICSNTVESH